MSDFEVGQIVNILPGDNEPEEVGDKIKVKITAPPRFIGSTKVYDFVYLEDFATDDWSCSIGENDWLAERWLKAILDLPVKTYTVRTNNEVILKTFDDLEKARDYRDGYNQAIYYWADGKYEARITIDVEEVQTVTVTQDVE